MRNYRFVSKVLSGAQRQALCDVVLAHPLVSESSLKGAFSATRGFSIAFTARRLPELINKFPFLLDFFTAIQIEKGMKHLYSPMAPARLFNKLASPNAFYFNVLLIPPQAEVHRHVDGTLQPYLDIPNLRPKMVSVLWLQSGGGGQLELFDGLRKLATVVPEEGSVIHFRGDLGHAVSSVQGKVIRVSMVLEQYVVPNEVTELLEPWMVHSKVPFSIHLQHAQQELHEESGE